MKKILRLMVLVVWTTLVVLYEHITQFKILHGLFELLMWSIIVVATIYVVAGYFI